MVNQIQVANFRRSDVVDLFGFELSSSYNHNYYVSTDGQVILERCNDDMFYSYTLIHKVNYINENGYPVCEETYLGAVWNNLGIFDEGYNGDMEGEFALVDTNCC